MIDLVKRQAGMHVCRLADWMSREPGLPGARDIGSIVVEIQDLVRPETQADGETAERLRVRLAPAEFGGKDRARAEDGTAGNTSAMCRFSSNGLLVNIATGWSVLSCRASESTDTSGSIAALRASTH